MKIEMGESLFYSWLRHVKECQLVQTNWKISSQWELRESDLLEHLMAVVDKYYSEKYKYNIFKDNASLSQLLRQGECDVLGISIQPDEYKYYAVDVAFHENGLNYGDRNETVSRVLKKCVRTAFALYGYFNTKEGEIIFASPKINLAVIAELAPCVEELNVIFSEKGFNYKFRIIANGEFNDSVLKPILLVSDNVADTSELFLRSYQMYTMFGDDYREKKTRTRTANINNGVDYTDSNIYKELKIGKLAQNVLAPMLRDGCASYEEIVAMQTKEYSKEHFHIQYPLLVKADGTEKARYYVKPIRIYGVDYNMCREWFETSANNDRPYLLKWIESHKK